MVAVAVRRAIMDICPVDVEIKWINDLLIQGKKICGILTEVAPQGGVIIGIGINCNQDTFPEELREIAASLKEFCGEVDRQQLLQALIIRLQELDQCLISHKVQWMEEYESVCVSIGREVLLISPTETREAFSHGIGKNGELLVRFPDGHEEQITMGEVSLRNKPSTMSERIE
jgi:BirA family biotin operon repressor/biotin-[acetyl-CoA-carboxylase] ligase